MFCCWSFVRARCIEHYDNKPNKTPVLPTWYLPILFANWLSHISHPPDQSRAKEATLVKRGERKSNDSVHSSSSSINSILSLSSMANNAFCYSSSTILSLYDIGIYIFISTKMSLIERAMCVCVFIWLATVQFSNAERSPSLVERE